MKNANFMQEAIDEAYTGINNNEGGPFGCVIVKDEKIVGRGHNLVLKNNDPTAHGEISAIRDAWKNLKTYDLTGCTLYSTAAPCPMCKGAIMWSNISKVYYGCRIEDTEKIGFRDRDFYDEFKKTEYNYGKETSRQECLKLFDDYNNKKVQRY